MPLLVGRDSVEPLIGAALWLDRVSPYQARASSGSGAGDAGRFADSRRRPDSDERRLLPPSSIAIKGGSAATPSDVAATQEKDNKRKDSSYG